MKDSYGREINYLRVSLTDRCNLRCRYCMPAEGIDKKQHEDILSLEEFYRLIKIATDLGIKKVRLTGGEPMVRKNIVDLIAGVSSLPEIDDIAMTTNGILFAEKAVELYKSGLNRVNISLDTLVGEKYRYITRGGELKPVIEGIFQAMELGMDPVKINTVIIKGFNDNEIQDFAELAYKYPLHVRFIEFMPIGDLQFWRQDKLMDVDEIYKKIQNTYFLKAGKRVKGNGPAKYYEIEGGKGSLGFISPMSNHFCGACNRIRLMADGSLRGCLYEKGETDLRSALRQGASDNPIRDLFIKTILGKARHHNMNQGWGKLNQRKMYQIGG